MAIVPLAPNAGPNSSVEGDKKLFVIVWQRKVIGMEAGGEQGGLGGYVGTRDKDLTRNSIAIQTRNCIVRCVRKQMMTTFEFYVHRTRNCGLVEVPTLRE